nr:hypothetical protein [Tanacetum cinerariifolium]
METKEISERYLAPCFVNRLEAYDGEINLRTEKNMISNEFAVKLYLDHEVRNGSKLVKKEFIIALRGEIYFAKFIINPEEDDVKPGVVLERDTPILVGRGFLYTCGSILNTIERITSTFDGIFHQTFCATKKSLDPAKSDSNDEEEYTIQRTNFGAPMYGPKPTKYLNYHDPLDRSIALQEVLNPFKKICVWKKAVSFLGSLPVALKHVDWKPKYTRNYYKKEAGDGQWHAEIRLYDPYGNVYDQGVVDWNVLNQMDYGGAINEMLTIKLYVAGTNKEIFTSEAWTNAFNINEPIYSELCRKFYSTYDFDEVCADDELRTKKIIKFRLCGHSFSWTLLEFAKRLGLYHSEEIEKEGFDVYFQGGLRSDEHFNAHEYWLSISREENLSLSRSHALTIRKPILRVLHKIITYGLCQRTTWHDKISLDTTTLREFIDSKGRLIPEEKERKAHRNDKEDS